jgi:hypothetical protein
VSVVLAPEHLVFGTAIRAFAKVGFVLGVGLLFIDYRSPVLPDLIFG